jgi:hypothetical protein
VKKKRTPFQPTTRIRNVQTGQILELRSIDARYIVERQSAWELLPEGVPATVAPEPEPVEKKRPARKKAGA